MAPTLINFTLRDNQFATASDSDDGGSDADVVSLIGPVKFIPQINRPALGATLSPQAMLSLRTIDGYYDVDGQLKNKRGGSVGVRIPANDPVLGLARLPYKAVYGPITTPAGDVVVVPDVPFDAPTTDTTVWLPSVAPVPGATALGITKGDKGDPVDDVQSALSNTAAQFYVKGTPIGDPLVLPSAAWGSILGKPDLTYLVDDYGAVDYTGATFSDAAVDAALAAMGTAPGLLEFGRGVVKLNTTKTFSRPGQAPKGQGIGLTTIDYRGTGDCFRVWDSTAVMDGAHGPSRAAPITGMFIDLLQNANINTCALHTGDLFGAFIDDVTIRPASGSGSKAAWFHNTYSWYERAFVRLNVVGSPSQVGDQITFSGDVAHPNGQTSFSYCQFYLSVDCEAPNQRGVVWTKNAQAAGIVFILNGNFVGGVSNTGTVLTVGTAPGDECLLRGHIQIMAETIGAGAVGYKDMDVAAASLVVGTGVLDFQDYGSSAFAAGSATRDTVAVAGYRHCPSLGTSDVYQPQYDTLKATNNTNILKLQGNSAAANYFNMVNRAAGLPPILSTVGADASIPIAFQPKGDAGFYTYVSNMAVSGVDFTVQGDPTDIGWNFITQGAGRLRENGVPVLSPAGIHAATGKATPVDADEFPLDDSAASFGLKKLTWANLKATLATWLTTLTATWSNKTLDFPIINGVLDANGNFVLGLQSNTSAANYIKVVNRAAGNPPYITVNGSDTNIPVMLNPKGTSGMQMYAGSSSVTALPLVTAGDNANVGLDVQTQGTERLRENGNIVGSWVAVPSTATSTGKQGQMAADSSWFYVCTATNTWRRVAIASW